MDDDPEPQVEMSNLCEETTDGETTPDSKGQKSTTGSKGAREEGTGGLVVEEGKTSGGLVKSTSPGEETRVSQGPTTSEETTTPDGDMGRFFGMPGTDVTKEADRGAKESKYANSES